MPNDQKVPTNVYSVLTVLALFALLAGVGFVVMSSNTLFGSPIPMEAKAILIQGKVVSVQESTATIDVGSDDSVEKGMELFVYSTRNNEHTFLGFIEIDSVQATQATGKLTLAGEKAVSQGDNVSIARP